MPRFCANLTMLYNEHGFFDRFAARAPTASKASSLCFLMTIPRRRSRGIGEFQDGVGRGIDYATALGCTQLNCLVGLTPSTVDVDRVRRVLVENLRFAGQQLADAAIRLLVEPVNSKDTPGFPLDRVDKAVAILDAVGSPNAFLQFDFYHQQRMDGELLATYRRLKDRIAHIQIADNPGRNEPGTGEVNYPFLFEALDREGYEGWIGCEYKPKTTTSAGLGWAEHYLSRFAQLAPRMLSSPARFRRGN